MNQKFEEKLIALAYGELEQKEAELLKNQIASDPALQARFDAYQFAFMGSATPEILPQPSLSNERLRQAILTQELRKETKPGFAKLTFGFASLTAALLAIAVVPKFLTSPEIKLPTVETAIANSEETPSVVAPAESSPITSPKELPATVKKSNQRSKITRKPTLYASREPKKPVTKVAISKPADNMFDEQLAGIAGGVTSAAVEREDADSVVFISGGGTAEGSKATEMKAPTGVPIGG